MKYATLFAALLQAAFVAHANPTIESNGVLTNREGRTLYTFDKDSSGTSVCKGGCLAAWPAFTVANASLAGGDFSIIARDDGVQQWTFQGKPLYFFAGDANAGDINGDNQGGVWHVVRKAAVAKTSRASAYESSGSYDYGYKY